MRSQEDESIAQSFWAAVPKNVTWQDLNNGMEIIFTFRGKTSVVNTRVANYIEAAIPSYKLLMEKRAIIAYKKR